MANKRNLSNACIRFMNLVGVKLRGVTMTNADVRWSILDGADLRDTDLRGANLRGSSLRGADLRGADLTDANLTDTILTGANLNGAIGANLENAIL